MSSQKPVAELSIDELCALYQQCSMSDMQSSEVYAVETFLESNELGDLQNNNQLVARLIQCEIDQKRKMKQSPGRAAYLERFPDLDPQVLDNLLLMPSLPPASNTGHRSTPLLPARYRVVEQIGKGGIGSVWRVEDREMRRTLAAKVLNDKFKFNPAANIRLQREALLAGALQHPGIPPVFEEGDLVTGSKFFTMKLVDGETLDDLLSKRSSPQSNQPYLLGVFRQIAEAVGYAHSKGVIHRDLKPQNVMVGEFGEVQIMDWGMAKRLWLDSLYGDEPLELKLPKVEKADATTESHKDTASMSVDSSLADDDNDLGLTLQGDVVGTPMYMSPEQAAGNLEHLTERSDVFSLGSILFEILTGQRLYAASGDELLQAAVAGDTTQAFTRLEASDADSELIDCCKTCLAFDPADRPENGHAIGLVIAKHLDSVAQRLRDAELEKTSTKVRLAEAVKRRKQAIWLSVAIVSAILAGLVGVVWQWNRAATNEAAAIKSAQESKESADRSSGVLQVVTDAFQSVNPDSGSDATMTAKEVLLNAQTSLDESDLDEEGRMILLSNLATCFRALGEYELAATSHEDALKLQVEILGERERDTLLTMNELAVVYLDLGRLKESLELQERVLELQKDELGIAADDTLVSMNNLGIVHEKMGNNKKALEQYEELLTIQDASGNEEHPDTNLWKANLANAYANLGRIEDAVKLNEELLAYQRKELGDDHPGTLLLMNNLSMSYKNIGRLDDAIELAKETLSRIKVKFGPDHPNTSIVMGNVALIHEYRGDFEEAVALNEETLKIKQFKFGEDHPETLITMNNLAATLKEVGRYDEALELQKKMLVAQQEKLGEGNRTTLLAMQNLADIYARKGEFEQALEIEEKTLKLRKEELGEDHPDTLMSMNNLAEVYKDLGRFDEALELLEETLERKRAKMGEEHTETGATMNNLAQVYSDVGRMEDAFELHQQTFELFRKNRGEDHPRTMKSATNVALSLRRLGKIEEAIQLFEETLERQKKKLGDDHADTLTTARDLAICYRQNDELEKAIALLKNVLVKRTETFGAEHPKTLGTMASLAYAYERDAQFEDAAALLEQALEIKTEVAPDHWSTFDMRSLLGGIFLKLGKVDEAAELLKSGYEGLKAKQDLIPAPSRTKSIKFAMIRLMELALEQNETEQFEEWKAKIEELDAEL